MAAAGFEPNIPIERASSVTNEVWMTRDAVLRINTQGDQRLRREALVALGVDAQDRVGGHPHLVGDAAGPLDRHVRLEPGGRHRAPGPDQRQRGCHDVLIGPTRGAMSPPRKRGDLD